MNDLRAAAQQALEALEANNKLINGEGSLFGLEGAMDGYYRGCFDVDGVNKLTDKTIRALRAALAQQEQGPVATVTECEACFTPDVCRLRGTCDHYSAQKLRVAHPPRREWQSLMPDDVFASDEIMAANASLGLRIDQLMDLVHAVEQALKERNT